MQFDVKIFDELESTNTYLSDLCKKETLDEGLVIQALRQTAGRGRYDREWLSREGNITLSILFKPAAQQNLGQLALVLAVAIAQTLEKLGIGQDLVHIKWPNDVLVNQKKISGILIEAAGHDVIAGIGLNVAFAPDERISVSDIISDTDVDVVRDLLLDNVSDCYNLWLKEGFDPIRSRWLAYAWKLGNEIEVKQRHSHFSGVFEDLDLDGHLIVKDESGKRRKISSAEIFELDK